MTTLSPGSQITLAQGIASAEVEGEITLLNTRTHEYLVLNDVGSRIWELIEQDGQPEAIYAQMLAEYDVDPAELWDDLLELVEDLESAGLVAVDQVNK